MNHKRSLPFNNRIAQPQSEDLEPRAQTCPYDRRTYPDRLRERETLRRAIEALHVLLIEVEGRGRADEGRCLD
jgi:hypothetical protein